MSSFIPLPYLFSIVVRVPERVLGEAVKVQPDDLLPVVEVRVDAHFHAHPLRLCGHVQHILAVLRHVAGPLLTLNVEPEHADVGALLPELVDRSFDLVFRGSTTRFQAGKDVRVDVGNAG